MSLMVLSALLAIAWWPWTSRPNEVTWMSLLLQAMLQGMLPLLWRPLHSWLQLMAMPLHLQLRPVLCSRMLAHVVRNQPLAA